MPTVVELISANDDTVPGNVRLCSSEEDYLAWDRFLFSFAGAHYFQTYGWLKSYQPMGLIAQILIHSVDGKITGGVAFLSAKIPLLPYRIVIIPHGPLPSDTNAPSWLPLMQRLDEICRESKAIYAQIYPQERIGESVLISRLAELGFTSPELFTSHRFSTLPVTLDLVGKTEEELLRTFRKRTISYVREAIRSDLEFRTAVDGQIFDKVYQLFKEHGESRGFRPRPYASLRLAWEWLSANGWATLVQAWHGDTLVGAGFVILTGRTAYYVHGAVRRGEFANRRPAEFLHWHTIRTAIQLGLDTYDLVNFGNSGVEQFKRGFRPEVRPWHEPRTRIYYPRIAKRTAAIEQSFRPLLRGFARHLAKWSNRNGS